MRIDVYIDRWVHDCFQRQNPQKANPLRWTEPSPGDFEYMLWKNNIPEAAREVLVNTYRDFLRKQEGFEFVIPFKIVPDYQENSLKLQYHIVMVSPHPENGGDIGWIMLPPEIKMEDLKRITHSEYLKLFTKKITDFVTQTMGVEVVKIVIEAT